MQKDEYEILANLLYPNVLDISFYFDKYKKRENKGQITRVAPSPTGYLHIGSVYQALANKLMADKTNGSFILRIEDTDQKRQVERASEIAYEMLVKFGLTPNEGFRADQEDLGDYGPYVQSKRLPIYHSFAHHLVKRGRAFPCFCQNLNSKEEILKQREEELENSGDLSVKDPCRNLTLEQIKENLLQNKPFALRLLSFGDPDKKYEFTDSIMGKKEIRENAKDDVLIKSNGIPVYAFAHVVDDTLMGTTTVVRGQDWFQSLPVHIELSQAFGFEPFKYAHTPNICIIDEKTGNKRKISKRKDSFADARFFLMKGYPVQAVIEYLLNLLNSDFEIWRKNNPDLPYTDFPFDIKKVGVTNPMFDFMKLNDISKTIISKMTAEQVYENALKNACEWRSEDVPALEQNKGKLLQVLSIDRGGERPRKDITTYSEILGLYDYILPNFNPTYELDFGQVKKANLVEFLKDYSNTYKELDSNQEWFEDLKQKSIKHLFVDNKTYKQQPDAYAGNVSDTSKFVRIAITGKQNSPELYSIMKILGVEECKNRLNKFIEFLNN